MASDRLARMRLNGWQRLWVVLSAVWTVVILYRVVPMSPWEFSEQLRSILWAWIAPVVGAYALGVAIAWVRRGFMTGGQKVRDDESSSIISNQQLRTSGSFGILAAFGVIWFIGLLVTGYLAYFVSSAGPVDGLGRPLSEAPPLMRVVFGQDRMWAGWFWFVADMVIFWGSIGIATALAKRSNE